MSEEHGAQIVPVIQAMPIMDMATARQRRAVLVDFVRDLMIEGTDFGTVPGTTKPTLLKPGAEKLTTFFGLSPSFVPIESLEDWQGADHGGEPLFAYRYKCQLFRGNLLVGEGVGSCNSWEKKYRFRAANRRCPKCGQEAIIKGREEYGGGWLCFAKKGGCGSKWPDGAAEIEGQTAGLVKNDNPHDQVNTIDKMAQKRALIAAALIAINASEFFTQDLEDMDLGAAIVNTAKPAASTPAPAPAAPPAPPKPAPAPGANGGRKPHPPTVYWTAVEAAGLDRQAGKAILDEKGGDFEAATEAVKAKHTPPGASDDTVPF